VFIWLFRNDAYYSLLSIFRSAQVHASRSGKGCVDERRLQLTRCEVDRRNFDHFSFEYVAAAGLHEDLTYRFVLDTDQWKGSVTYYNINGQRWNRPSFEGWGATLVLLLSGHRAVFSRAR
jgi:hypothetical protein